MKKLAIVAALMSTSAFAGSFVELTVNPSVKNEATKQRLGDVFGATFGQSVGPVTLDLQLEGNRATPVTNAVEGRATYNVGPAWGRVGYGRAFSDGRNDGYMTYAVGVNYPVVGGLTGIANAEYTKSMKSDVRSFTTYQVGAGYDISKSDNLALTYNRALGGQNTSSFQLAFSRRF